MSPDFLDVEHCIYNALTVKSTTECDEFCCVFITQQVSFTVSCLEFPASGFCPAWQ